MFSRLLGCGQPEMPTSTQPTIPIILKGKKKQLFKKRQVYSPEHACSQQAFVHLGSTKSQSNIRQTNTQGGSKIEKQGTLQKQIGDEIRVRLDENLERVYHALREKKNVANREQLIEKNLVHQYIRLIYQDYSIPDPMEKHVHVHSSPFKQTNGQRFSNFQNTRNSQKQYGPYIVQMFSPSHVPSSPSMEYPLHKIDNRRTSGEVSMQQQRDHEIESVYRYCFVCQEPVLEANIEIHQRKCPSFSSLYTLGLKEIKESIVNKVIRIRNELEQLNEICQQNQGKGQATKKSLLRQVKNYVLHVDLGLKDKANEQQNNSLKYSFNSVIDCFDQSYFKIYENVKKLQWFSLMLKNLNEKYPQKENYKANDMARSIMKNKQNCVLPVGRGQRRHSLAH